MTWGVCVFVPQMNDNQIENWSDLDELKNAKGLQTVYLERNPLQKDPQYRRKIMLALPSVRQIDATFIRFWPHTHTFCLLPASNFSFLPRPNMPTDTHTHTYVCVYIYMHILICKHPLQTHTHTGVPMLRLETLEKQEVKGERCWNSRHHTQCYSLISGL